MYGAVRKRQPWFRVIEVEKLINFKRQGVQLFPCYVSGCTQLQDIDGLLRNAPAARQLKIETIVGNRFDELKIALDKMREQLDKQDRASQDRFVILNANDRRVISQIDDAYARLMQAMTDEAKEGPRLFGLEPMDRRLLDRPKWMSGKFKLTLWCEHSRLPLPVLNPPGDRSGVYELDIPKEWFIKSVRYLKIVTGLLSLVVPVAASAAKLELDKSTYKGIEKQLDFGQKSISLR